MRHRTLVYAICLALTGPTAGAQLQPQHLRLSLVAEQSRAVPGRPLLLGLDFRLDSGWHIYWVNSGDSGEPPQVRWKLPPGFAAGELEYPFPERLDNGPLTDYGYKDQVLLLAPVSTPGNIPGPAIALSAEVRWLVCREICIPGRSEVELTLPVVTGAAAGALAKSKPELSGPRSSKPGSSKQRSTDAGRFDQARDRLPKSLPKGWRASVSSEGDYFLLSIHAGKSIASATFFPLEAQQVENSSKPLLHTTPDGVRMRVKKSEQLLHRIHRLRGVFVVGEHAYLVDAPVKTST